MNEVLKAIRNRRSIRDFKEGQINEKDLRLIIQAGIYAPSANNSQNWHFTIIQNKKLLQKLNNWILNEIQNSGNQSLHDMLKNYYKNGIFRNAPTVVIVSSERSDKFGIINAAAAAENILIAAESLGIGSCWIGMVAILAASVKADSYYKLLHLPDGYIPQIGITLGYKSDDIVTMPKRREGVVSFFP
jgi:nitroreductase